MTGSVIFMIIIGLIVVFLSFFLSEKFSKFDSKNETHVIIDEDYEFSEIELKIIKEKIEDVIAEHARTLLYDTNESLANMANEKTMALGDYAVAVCEEIEKNHKEVMFLYSMLDDKHKEVMTAVNVVDAAKKEVAGAKKELEKTKRELYETIREISETRSKIAKEQIKTKVSNSKISQKKTAIETLSDISNAKGMMKEKVNHDSENNLDHENQEEANISRKESKIVSKEDMISEKESEKISNNPVLESNSVNLEMNQDNVEKSKTKTTSSKTITNRSTKKESSSKTVDHKESTMNQEHNENQEEVNPQDIKNKKIDDKDDFNIEDVFAALDQEDLDFDDVLEEEFQENENSNDIILGLYKNGNSIIDIAKQLGLGVGEVKLVVDLYQGK